MLLSLNQIEATARKAVRGSGLCWGLAEDAGRAVSRLEMAGLPAMRWLVVLLDHVPHENPGVQRLHWRDGLWWSENGALSPLMVGPNLADRIYAPGDPAQSAEQRLQGVACPALLAGYLSIAVLLSGRTTRMAWQGTRMEVAPDHLRVAGTPDAPGPADVSVGPHPEGGDASSAQEAKRYSFAVAAREVDRCTLDVLESLAHRTYVEASESSRLSGAGAGLSDND